MRAEYLEGPCRSALNKVTGMGFRWSLDPYMGCAHRCAFCYVRGFERRADRPSDGRYGSNVRVKINVADVLRTELSRRSWRRETVAVGAATDPYRPAEGRYGRLYPDGGSGYLRPADAHPIESRLAAVKRGARIEDRRRIRLHPPPDPEQLQLLT